MITSVKIDSVEGSEGGDEVKSVGLNFEPQVNKDHSLLDFWAELDKDPESRDIYWRKMVDYMYSTIVPVPVP